jgi:hypothetical protein
MTVAENDDGSRQFDGVTEPVDEIPFRSLGRGPSDSLSGLRHDATGIPTEEHVAVESPTESCSGGGVRGLLLLSASSSSSSQLNTVNVTMAVGDWPLDTVIPGAVADAQKVGVVWDADELSASSSSVAAPWLIRSLAIDAFAIFW